MSHFNVLVIGSDIENQLQPFHEFECTGEDDRYVQDINETEKARADFETSTSRRFQAPDGSLHDPYTDRFKVMSTDNFLKGPQASYPCPAGFQEVQVPTSTVEDFRDYCTDNYASGPVVRSDELPDLRGKHKYGYVRVDNDGQVAEVIDRTNPNKKWDGYLIGGRWSGYFTLKEGCQGLLGKPGLRTPQPTDRNVADIVRKDSVDFDAMRNAKEARAATEYDAVHAIIAGRPVVTWAEARARFPDDFKAPRELYNTQKVVMDLKANRDVSDMMGLEAVDRYMVSREEFLHRARNRAGVTFALLKDGQWYERGSMGWWGAVSDEKDEGEWEREYATLLDSLPGDTLLTVVDCHI